MTGIYWNYAVKPVSNSWADDEIRLRYDSSLPKNERVYQLEIKRSLFLDGAYFEDAIATIRRLADGIVDAYIDYEWTGTEHGPNMVVLGWDASPDSSVVDEVLKFMEDRNKAMRDDERKRAQEDLARIRKRFPELFND